MYLVYKMWTKFLLINQVFFTVVSQILALYYTLLKSIAFFNHVEECHAKGRAHS